MSTARENTPNDVLDLGNGVTATPNPYGTYTVTGGGDFDGTWEQVTDMSNIPPNAVFVGNTGTDLDGTIWAPAN